MASLIADVNTWLSLVKQTADTADTLSLIHPYPLHSQISQATSSPQISSHYSMEFAVDTLQQAEVPKKQDTGSRSNSLVPLTGSEFPFFLSMPTKDDDLQTTARKMQSIASVISGGRTLSMTPGHVSTRNGSKPKQKHNAEDFARQGMTGPEIAQYDAWKMGLIQLPTFDWYLNRLPVGPTGMRTFSRRAIAMDIIWKRPGFAPEHAAWLAVHMNFMLPVVKAVTKVLMAAEELQRNEHLQMSYCDIAEMEMLQLINSTAEETVTRERERMRMLRDSIHRSQAVLTNRINTLEK
ncbi:hypothetical protein N7448_006523 [Penicillium atrosanguineum]|uniref:Uncharacterized protein n=1 Tax=Penicillium atrosanguineum TaxID=1132637 RepID=A0A9W9PUW6_9EURO|nr:uncharacterized protein N7443_010286 [Penicillium atrosanguineum]KAJ5132365.1 hypothetical protein N7448_006523 [Penicillium atrosanguineum]KAJ5137422.1 hypothetical protein N7526_003655 [Penicillium atrosanguineum]KAJ5290033.1 hypothetical protein N7443_010286 [Penicillium atrosanguineum]KAJ5307854.1 hypothetical protein N7476_008510 [Penicillium atrosanguineum]